MARCSLLAIHPIGAKTNRAGADGWELADREVRVHGDGDHYRDASWTRTTYTFKCLVPE